MYEDAMGKFAADDTPLKKRARKIRGRLSAPNSIKYDAPDITIDDKIIGFLPNLSESLPKKGEKKNCPRENVAAMNPICNADAWYFSAKRGRIGKIIPNPIMLIKTVK